MARTSQSRLSKQTRRRKRAPAAKHPVIDNRQYPSTEEVARILNVPAARVRQLKDLAAKTLEKAHRRAIEIVPLSSEILTRSRER